MKVISLMEEEMARESALIRNRKLFFFFHISLILNIFIQL